MKKRKSTIRSIVIAAFVVIVAIFLAFNWNSTKKAAEDAWNNEYSPGTEETR